VQAIPRASSVCSDNASGISHNQKTPRLMRVGVHVLPVPLNDCVNPDRGSTGGSSVNGLARRGFAGAVAAG
jgi:hypothetical protein